MQHIFCFPVFCLSLRDLIDTQDAKDILPRMNKHYKIYPTDERNTRADSIFLKPSVLSLLFLKSADSLAGSLMDLTEMNIREAGRPAFRMDCCIDAMRVPGRQTRCAAYCSAASIS